jgi:hypothetical protein
LAHLFAQPQRLGLFLRGDAACVMAVAYFARSTDAIITATTMIATISTGSRDFVSLSAWAHEALRSGQRFRIRHRSRSFQHSDARFKLGVEAAYCAAFSAARRHRPPVASRKAKKRLPYMSGRSSE